MKIGIYTRVSTEEQKKTGISLRDQEQRGIEFCIRNGFEYEVFSDGGYSGELSIEQRPQLNRLVEKLLTKPKEIDGIVTAENEPIKLEVGIEDWLHLVFDVKRSKFHLKDCITGQVVFKKVSIRLKSMELQIIKKETLGAGNFLKLKINKVLWLNRKMI